MYQNSDAHKANAKKARLLGRQAIDIAKQARVDAYYADPKRCIRCDEAIPYGKNNKFCSKSCSAQHNNVLRTQSESTRKQISAALVGRKKSPEAKLANMLHEQSSSCKVEFAPCTICGTMMCHSWRGRRKTCSEHCRVIASTQKRSYQNGSRKPSQYLNPTTGESVLLESSWEVQVAQQLDQLNIPWTRPAPIRWVDSTGKSRLYYPDFYIPQWDTYLDPKNPYCMKQDEEKMRVVGQKIQLVFGPLEYILAFIQGKTTG